MEPGHVLAAVAPAAAAALAVFALAHQPWRREAPWGASWRSALGAIAIGAAFVLAVFLVPDIWRGFWPRNAHSRVPLVALGAVAAEVLAHVTGRPTVGFAARTAAVGLLLWAVAEPLLGGVPTARRFGLWMPGLGVAVLGWWLLVERVAERERGACLPVMLWLTAGAASMLLLFGAHTVSLSLLAASVAAGLGALVVHSWWRARISAAGAAGVAAALLASLLLTGYLSSVDRLLAPWMIGMMALAPFCVLVRRVPAVARLRPWAGTLVCVLAGAALVLPPAIVAFLAYDAG